MPRPKLSPEAEQDLDEIYLFGVMQYGLSHTDTYAAGLRAAVERVGHHPHMVRERDEVRPPVRLLTYGAHNIFYDVSAGQVTIIRIMHHSADWMHTL